MSLRDGVLPSKQSPVTRGDCFATCARNDMQMARLASLPQLQSASGEELSPPLHFGDALQSALMPPVLRPQGGAFREGCDGEKPSTNKTANSGMDDAVFVYSLSGSIPRRLRRKKGFGACPEVDTFHFICQSVLVGPHSIQEGALDL
jgi:hypothetical protein